MLSLESFRSLLKDIEVELGISCRVGGREYEEFCRATISSQRREAMLPPPPSVPFSFSYQLTTGQVFQTRFPFQALMYWLFIVSSGPPVPKLPSHLRDYTALLPGFSATLIPHLFKLASQRFH